MTKIIIKCLIACLFVVTCGIGAYYYWQHSTLYPSTDDAYVGGDITSIASQVSGQIESVKIKNNQSVSKGQLLFTLDSQLLMSQYKQAQANLERVKLQVAAQVDAVKIAAANLTSAKAQAVITHKNADRIIYLAKRGKASIAAADDVKAKLESANAAEDAAKLQLHQAKINLGQSGSLNANIQYAKSALEAADWNLRHARVTAPVSGTISQLTLTKGQVVNQGAPLFNIISQDHFWVEANFKETQLGRIKPGQSATVTLDMYPKQCFRGKVDSIGAGTGAAFSLFPAENATGNWVKVTQRIPVRIKLIPKRGLPLRIGASSSVVVDTRQHG